MADDNGNESNHAKRPLELFGIHQTNVDTVVSKNRFATFFPVSTALYLSSKDRPIKYLRINNGELDVTEIMFERAIGVDSDRLKDVHWNSETHPKLFDKSAEPPQMDMVPTLGGREMLEFEVKLTVVPTFNAQKITEMIVRQNTQFSLAERLAYRHRNLVDVRPVDEGTLRNMLRHEECQLPFILHGLWRTVGTNMVLHEFNATDVLFISDFAYVKILLDKLGNNPSSSSRVAKVVRLIRSWIANYVENGTMRYKEKKANVEHLKVTIYPTDHLGELKHHYRELRLPLKDVWNIVPEESIRKMSPERRLDAALFSTSLIQSMQKQKRALTTGD